VNIIFFFQKSINPHIYLIKRQVAVYYSLIIYVNNITFQIFTYIGAQLNNTRWWEL